MRRASIRSNVYLTATLRGREERAFVTLYRTPTLLRFVWKAVGKKIEWDALDQLSDAPRYGESIIVAIKTHTEGAYHVKGAASVTGYYNNVHYVVYHTQPDYQTARDTNRWQEWCFEQQRLGFKPSEPTCDSSSNG